MLPSEALNVHSHNKRVNVSVWITALIISAVLASMAIPANMNAVGQIGSMATLQYIDAT